MPDGRGTTGVAILISTIFMQRTSAVSGAIVSLRTRGKARTVERFTDRQTDEQKDRIDEQTDRIDEQTQMRRETGRQADKQKTNRLTVDRQTGSKASYPDSD